MPPMNPELPASGSGCFESATAGASEALAALADAVASPAELPGPGAVFSTVAAAAVAGALAVASAPHLRRIYQRRQRRLAAAAAAEGDMLLAANALPAVRERGFSVVSSNLLTRRFDSRNYSGYCQKEHAAWARRLEHHKRLMRHIGADVYALQEGSIGFFEEDFASLREEGYGLVAPWDKVVKKTPERAATLDKTALAYRLDVFELEWVDHRSRVLLAQLRHRRLGRCVVVANCHLEGHPEKADARFTQLRSALEVVAKRGEPGAAVVFCGDFNSNREGSAYALLAEGRLEAGHADPWMPGRPVSDEAYASPVQLRDCYAGSRLAAHPTFLGSGNPQQIDFVFASTDLQVEALREPHTAEQWEDVRKTGAPNAWHPSDHFAVGAALTFA